MELNVMGPIYVIMLLIVVKNGACPHCHSEKN